MPLTLAFPSLIFQPDQSRVVVGLGEVETGGDYVGLGIDLLLCWLGAPGARAGSGEQAVELAVVYHLRLAIALESL